MLHMKQCFPFRWLFFCALLLVVVSNAFSQEISPSIMALQRIEGPVTLDGLSDEPAWSTIDPLPLTVYQPVYQAPPTQKTEIRVAYDDDYLYVAGRMFDSNPDGIRGNSLYRDQYSGDDVMAIVLDSFNDNENALWFSTTPTGVRFDWAVANDAQFSGDFFGAINRSWNTFWDAKTQKTDEGWFAEMRIPFSSLRFQDDNGRVVMGMSAYRFIARSNERQLFPATPPNWSLGWAKASEMQDIEMQGVYSKKPVYITPYVLGGLNERAILNDPETAYLTDNDFTREIGADLKYNLTSNLALDLTVNTDFAQVEADDEQVNLSRISLFFPEKRQFFQERAGIFEYSTGRQDRLFYSRRIGLDSDNQPVRILGGARVVGRIGSWDVGFINMQTGTSDLLPSENFGVLRLRRQFINPFSYAGGMVTTRLGNDGNYNVAAGIDAIFRPFGDDYITFRLAETFDRDLIDSASFDAWRANLLRLQWERRSERGFSYRGTVKRYGPDFKPEVGFLTRLDIVATAGTFGYGWFGDEEAWYRRIGLSNDNAVIFRNDDGSVETGRTGMVASIETKSGTRISFGPEYSYEDIDEALEFPEETIVPVGSYGFWGIEGSYFQSNANRLRMASRFSAGQFYDGRRLSLGVGPEWRPSQYFILEPEYELNRVRFPERDEQFTAHILRMRFQIALNTSLSLASLVQYSSASDFVTTNFRFRYNFKEGNDLWLVFNEGTNTALDRDIDQNRPLLPRRSGRIILLKYTYTFGG